MKLKQQRRISKTTLILLCILLVGLVARIVHLGSTPQGLHADEASFLLNAQSLLETGKDEDGRLLPLSLHSLIDPKPALYSYLEIPFVTVLGANATAGRLPAVIAGIVSLWLLYVMLDQLGVKKNVSLAATLVLAISPWHIMMSRATQEVMLSFVCALAAIVFFLKFIKTKLQLTLIPFSIFSLLSMYFYHSNKIFLLALFFSWSVLLLWQKKISLKSSSTVVGLTIFILILSLLLQNSSTRFAAVGFTSNQGPQLILNDQIRKATGITEPVVMRIFYNKGTFYGREVINQYLKHFSPDFLFFLGGEPKRYLVPYHGLFFLIELPLLVLGLVMALREKTKASLYMVIWLVLAPLPAALTFQETPSVIRTFVLVVPMVYFIAEGIAALLHTPQLVKRFTLVILAIAYLWSVAYFWQQLSVQQKVDQPWYRNTPYTKIAEEVKKVEGQYNHVYVINDLRPLYAYFALEGLIPISDLQQQPYARDQEIYNIGKYTFSRQQCDIGEPQEGVLYIAESQCVFPSNSKYQQITQETISYDDGVPVYSLVSFEPVKK